MEVPAGATPVSYDPKKHGAKCDSCPRNTQVPVPPEGKPGARVAWIGQDPGQTEARLGRPFVGATGTRLLHIWDRACAAAGQPIPRSEIWITNAALCLAVTGKEKEARDAVLCCRPRLLNELKRCAPDAALLLMGKGALLAVTGKTKGMGALTGFHIPIDLKNFEADDDDTDDV